MAVSIVVDTNVWLGNYLGFRSTADTDRRFINYCCENEINLMCGAISLKDIYYLIQLELKRVDNSMGGSAVEEIAWKCIENLTDLATIVAIDESDVWLAGKFHRIHRDLEDDLLIAAVKRTSADYLITWDKKLLNKSIVPTLTPMQFLELDP